MTKKKLTKINHFYIDIKNIRAYATGFAKIDHSRLYSAHEVDARLIDIADRLKLMLKTFHDDDKYTESDLLTDIKKLHKEIEEK